MQDVGLAVRSRARRTPVETPDTESEWTVREKKARKAPKAPEVAPEPRMPKSKASRRETAQSLQTPVALSC